jgi:peptide/nickel transport system ATP-binding protein
MEKSVEPVLDIRDLYVEYLTDRGPVRAVEGVSFAIQPGEVFGLAGESACGKSTIAHSILRVLRPPAVITGGQILYKGSDVLKMEGSTIEGFRWAEVSMVFQSAMNSLNPVVKIEHQLTDVLMKHLGVDRSEARKRAEELMDVVNIDKQRLAAYPHELSGGMRQRVVIAIALALKPSLMIMDEPTTALDVVVQKDILQQINQLKKEYGFSILFITHDLSLMVEFSDRIGIMYAGQLVELAPAGKILSEPLHPYTKGLLSSFPSITGARAKLSGIPGAPPNLLDPPIGCRFKPRCAEWEGLEMEKSPRLREVAPGHMVACPCNFPGEASGVN